MYLTVSQHDLFRTLLMGFEIPYRKYIASVITTKYPSPQLFDQMMHTKCNALSVSSPTFLSTVLPKECASNHIMTVYNKFVTATTAATTIISNDVEIPMVGALNLVTFALTEDFSDLYSLFGSYNKFCDIAELYRYARNKLDHPGSRTLEDSHLVPVLSFVKEICLFLEDTCFIQKSRTQILKEIVALQQRKTNVVSINNFSEMPYGEARIVCRDSEIAALKEFVYGKPGALRKQHSCCIYGYGGIGKTALVLEAIKQIVCDIQDHTTVNEYTPHYILFFSAKKRKITMASETGQIIEQHIRCHFESASELVDLIMASLKLDKLNNYHSEGLIIVDNLETLSIEERKTVKEFVETKTPSEMQFILTSRNSEDYESNFKLAGFDTNTGLPFIDTYCEENALDLDLSADEKVELLDLSLGNTLVLVLGMRRLAKRLSTVGTLKAEFEAKNVWSSLHNALKNTPANAYGVIAEFMYKDTFENIETAFSCQKDLFYRVLKVFAVLESESTDANTVCLLTGMAYKDVMSVIVALCNYLILEKKDTQYALNEFAGKYIIQRFLPDAETYEKLSSELAKRQREVKNDLDNLEREMKARNSLRNIISDWHIDTDIDRITAAKLFASYWEVKNACENEGRHKAEYAFEEYIARRDEAERLTAHPFIKHQTARVLQIIDASNLFPEKHTEEIKKAFNDAIYSINTIEQYSEIQQTKSYASLLWLFGQFLYENGDQLGAMHRLEQARLAFEELKIFEKQYYQCISLLGKVYLNYYKGDLQSRKSYYDRAEKIRRILYDNYDDLGSVKKYAGELKAGLLSYKH